MYTYVISKLGPHGKNGGRVPAIYKYLSSGLQNKDGIGQWWLTVVDEGVTADWVTIDTDPDVMVIQGDDLNDTIPPARRTAVNTRLGTTDLAVTLVVGDTYRTGLVKIGEALGHTEDFILGIQ